MPETGMGNNSWCEARILDEIEHNQHVSQRDLSSAVGIALGRTNQILKRLIRKGLVKTHRVNAKRMAYYLTPKGLSEKLALVMRYANRTISFFSAVRDLLNQRLVEIRDGNGAQTVAILGTGELAEAVYLSVQEMGFVLVGVFDDTRSDEWFGQAVRPLCEIARCEAEIVVWTEMMPVPRVLPVKDESVVVIEMSRLLSRRLSAFARRIAEETPHES